ncbi:MAG: hypothetical protein M1833_004148 [Piccolia ochrophora]|nr:MAG: hypothetical protein M1833_004148 [Piccolia ochrophora]
MPTGSIRTFDNSKGYGFIIPDTTGTNDIFVHYTAVQSTRRVFLSGGMKVEFEFKMGPKGTEAANVRVVG